MKCAIVGCENEAVMRNEEEKYLQCCLEHMHVVKECLEEQYNKEQQEMYDDWVRSQI